MSYRNISFTKALATLLGVPFKLSSCKSIPKVFKISRTLASIRFLFSSSEISKASALKGVLAEECSQLIHEFFKKKR